MIRPLLKRLWRGIFTRHARMAMKPSVITQKPMEIQESNDKNEEEGVGAIKKLIEVMIDIGEIIKITQKEMQPQMAK